MVQQTGQQMELTDPCHAFSLYNNNLYAVTETTWPFSTSQVTNPKKRPERIFIGWNVETIFSYKEPICSWELRPAYWFIRWPIRWNLFSSRPYSPFWFAIGGGGCFAYVTIHSGRQLRTKQWTFIVDVSDVKSKTNWFRIPMKNPKGLGVDKGICCFYCDDGNIQNNNTQHSDEQWTGAL